jgi:hypothetical protein
MNRTEIIILACRFHIKTKRGGAYFGDRVLKIHSKKLFSKPCETKNVKFYSA